MLCWLSTIAGSMASPFTLSSPQSLTSERLAAGSTKWGKCSSEIVDTMMMSLYQGVYAWRILQLHASQAPY